MFINPFSVYLTFIIAISTIKCNFRSINWNASTDRGNSHLEREYKYPMFHKVSPSPCDLTDSCDVFCCQDPDCDETQKQSFQCSEYKNNVLEHFDCNFDYHDKPEWMSWFCYVFKNPSYLGKFYETPSKIEKIGVLKNLIANKMKNFRNFEASKPKSVFQFGSPIMTYSPIFNSNPSLSPLMMKTPIQDSCHACTLTPVKFHLKGTTTCLKKITSYLCESDQSLSILPHLIQDATTSSYDNTPIVLKNLDFLKGIETKVQIKCTKPKILIHKFKKRTQYIFQKDSVCEESVDTYQTVWSSPICENVLASVHYHFTVNGSELVKLNVEYNVMNISIPSGVNSDSLFHQYTYIKQVFNISFHDIMNNTYKSQNSSANDDLFSRGYFIGEKLNFGNKSFEDSSPVWKKGFIGIFNNATPAYLEVALVGQIEEIRMTEQEAVCAVTNFLFCHSALCCFAIIP